MIDERFIIAKQKIEAHCKSTIPGFAIVEKESVWWVRVLGTVLGLLNRDIKRYAQTFYPKVYFPKESMQFKDNGEVIRFVSLLAHEWVHLSDRKRLGGLAFTLLYLSPQILSLFSILAVFDLWFLLFLLFLAPIPSPGRMWLELRAYKMSVAVTLWLSSGNISTDFLVGQFTTGNYYFMWPFGKSLVKKFAAHTFDLVNAKRLPDYIEQVKNSLLEK